MTNSLCGEESEFFQDDESNPDLKKSWRFVKNLVVGYMETKQQIEEMDSVSHNENFI